MISLVTPPSTTLVTLAELKAHLVYTDNDQDTRLNLLLATTSDFIETETNQCLRPQTWKQSYSGFYPQVELKKLPISAVSVKYYDLSNTERTLNPIVYSVLAETHYGHIQFTQPTPDNYDRPDSVNITLTCGYPSVPNVAKQACLLLAASWNENREAESIKSVSQMGIGFDRLINSLRRGIICG